MADPTSSAPASPAPASPVPAPDVDISNPEPVGDETQTSLKDRLKSVFASKANDKDGEQDEEKTTPVPFFQLFKYAQRHEYILLIIGLVSAAIHGTQLPLFCIVFGSVIDALGVTQFSDNLAGLVNTIGDRAKWFFIFGAIAFVTSFIQVRYTILFAQIISNRLRLLYFSSLMRQDISWYDGVEKGALASRVSSDVNLVEAGIGEKVASAVQFLSSFITGMIIAFVYGWKLALIVISSAPFLIISGALYAKLAASGASSAQDAYASAGAIASEVLSLIRTVFSFNGQEAEAKRYEKKLQSAYLASVRKSAYTGLAVGFTYFVIFSVFSIAFIYGGLLVRRNEMSGGDIFVTFFAVFVATLSIGQAAPGFTAITTARGAAPRVYDVIQRESEIDPSNSEEGLIPESFSGDIEFKNVKFNYPKRTLDNEETRARPFILDDLKLHVKSGSSHALVGPSGCGKSTTVRLIERFYDVNAGYLLLDGIDVREYNVQWLRNQIGYVGQMPTLFMLSIRDNIALGLPMERLFETNYSPAGKTQANVTSASLKDAVSDHEIIEAAKMANAHDFIMKLPEQYDTMLGERGALLSGGQKQRICIARALIRNPKILLLDESTSALDAASERHVQDALDKASQGRTTVTIAHRLSTVKNADVISVFSDGQVDEQGTHEELLKLNGTYKTLVENQNIAAQSNGDSEDQDNGAGTSSMVRDKTKEKSTSKTKTFLGGDGKEIEDDESVEAASDPGVFKRAFIINSGEWFFILLGMIGSGMAGSAFPLMALVFANVTGDLFQEDNESAVRRSAILFVVIGCGAFVGYFLQHSMLGVSGARLTRKLRSLAFRAYLRQEVGFFDRKENSVGQLTTRLATEATLVQGITGDTLGSLTLVVSTLLTGLLVAYLSCWEISLVVTAVVPLMALSEAVQVKMLAGFDADSGEKYASAGAVASEAVDNLDTVTSLGIQQFFKAKYAEELEGPLRDASKRSFISGMTFGFAEFLMQALWGIALWVGSVFVEKGHCTLINLMRGISGLLFAGSTLGQTAQFMPDFPKSRVAATKIFRLLDRVPEMHMDGTIQKPSSEVRGAVSTDAVHFEYPTRPDVPVLRGLSINAQPGQTVALVGESGCGKSTIVSLLQRFYDVRAGSVRMDGIDTREYDVKNLRSHLSYVSQEPDLMNRSVRDNIAYGLDSENVPVLTDEMIREAAQQANAHDFITQLPEGYDTVVGTRGERLSGGQRQRVAIARALIRQPRILLLDESTSALDAVSERIVQDALNAASSGRTTIAIAHRLSTIKDADEICVIERGRVVEKGTHSDLMAKGGSYATLVKNQTDHVEN